MYYFRALPFGLNTAPLLFTRIVEAVAAQLRKHFSIHVHVYLGDWLFCHHEREVLVCLMPQILDFIQDLGWEVNLDKSSIVPSQNFEYFGLHFVTNLLDLV